LQFRATFEDMLVSKEANDTAADFIKRKIRSIVKDPRTAAILSDIDHPCGFGEGTVIHRRPEPGSTTTTGSSFSGDHE
jgi:hypothetical protein